MNPTESLRAAMVALTNPIYPVISISGYKHYTNQKGEVKPGCLPYETDLYKELIRIRDGHYRPVIDTLRGIDDKDERMLFKQTHLPSITVSAICHTWREIGNLVAHTGLLNIDIDQAGNEWVTDWGEMRDKIFEAGKDILTAFVSASAKGMSFIVRINPEQHKDTFESIREEMKNIFNLSIDKVTKDVVRLRFLSYDPFCKIRFNFNELQVVTPTSQYQLKKAREIRDYSAIMSTGEPDSVANFRNAMNLAISDDNLFVNGNKHCHLIAVAGYCNSTGMNEQYCKKMVIKFYRTLTTIKDDQLLKPVSNVYESYKSQFGKIPLRQPRKFSLPTLKWLLQWFAKSHIRKNLHLLGQEWLPGKTNYCIRVDNKILAFAMWLAAPEYTWTTINHTADQHLTAEKCREIFKDGMKITMQDGHLVYDGNDVNLMPSQPSQAI